MTATAAALQVDDIHKSFGRLEVLRGISLSARDGDVIAILGSSGSGKSTFLRCLNLLEQPDRGAIRLRGEPLDLVPDRRGQGLTARSARQLAAFRARIGFVFQSFNLWPHLSVLGNVTEAPVHVKGVARAEARDRGLALLEKVGIVDKRDSYPSHLSGGQQQRAAIARALAMDPEVILFDEPTSALDPELVTEVLGVIRALAEEGRTMLIVTHEMGFARDVASEVIFLHKGRIEEQGPPGEIFHQPKTERARQFLAKHLVSGS